ncbi:unnamed protein product [Heligmosomoides polygyrus]|uniref:Lipase_3 domain-containing protein n=1 Tax=Heligmosomoides polygyrus TaxID=6339 RepID=A0A3P8A6F3_HELPZ|nr:unnamed protein product [Heligmosomoides polygyrus]
MLNLVSAAPAVHAEQPAYSDEFARTKVVPLCAATQLDNPQICLSRQFANATTQRRVTVRCDEFSVDTCSGFVAINHADKAIMLAFRGTIGSTQMIVESEETVFGEMVTWVAGGTVSKYFYNAFTAVWSAGIKDDFLTLKSKYPSYELWIVGHSLGGSMASLAASYIEKMKLFDGNLIKLVTFGQPRTGDKDFAAAHEAQIPYTFRVTHAHDVIPHSPAKGLRNYYHHKSEASGPSSLTRSCFQAFYNNDMSKPDFVVCNEGESNQCSDQNVDLSFNDHHRYFNVYIMRWGVAGCTGDPVNPPFI